MKYFEEHEDLDSLLRRFNKKLSPNGPVGLKGGCSPCVIWSPPSSRRILGDQYPRGLGHEEGTNTGQ